MSDSVSGLSEMKWSFEHDGRPGFSMITLSFRLHRVEIPSRDRISRAPPFLRIRFILSFSCSRASITFREMLRT